MKNNYNVFPWSENWWIEDDEAWFVLGMQKILCCLDLNTNKCKLAVCIPDIISAKYRMMSGCVKCRNDIYCIPNTGSSIWVYSVDNCSFSEIAINNPDEIHLEIYDYWKYENKIFAVSIGLKQIIEINISEKKIENYYDFCGKEGIARSVKVGTMVYVLSGAAKVYGFDLITKSLAVYSIPDMNKTFNTICFDGKEFWLSGYYKEVYVWNKESNEISIKDNFPDDFGIYNFGGDTDGKVDCLTNPYILPVFLYSAAVGKYVWFIPFQTNQIIYADKEQHKLYEFKIGEETETRESLLGRTNFKSRYILEYVRCNRYLGLFSIKNNRVLEIDTEELKYKWCGYCFSDKNIKEYADLLDNMFDEGDEWDIQSYNRLLRLDTHNICCADRNSVGADIYKKIMNRV